MMYYRLTPKQFAYDLTGTGGLISEGRWHSIGSRILYASNSIEVAIKEARVRNDTSSEFALQTFEIPDTEIMTLAVEEGWDTARFQSHVQAQGDEFLRQGESVACKIPTRYLPPDHPDQPTNLLINPKHPDFNRLRITIEPFQPLEDQIH